MRKAWIGWAAALLALLLLAGCGMTAKMERRQAQDQLREASHDYSRRLRWRDWSGAAEHLRPDLRKALLDRIPELKDLQVTDLQEVKVLPGKDENSRLVAYRMEYVLMPSPVVRELRWSQTWERIDDQWLLTDPFPPLPTRH